VKKICTVLFIVLVLISLTVISCKKETSCEECANKENKPPISIAGPDQLITLPTDSILLDGRTSSDPDGSISSYLWTKISGPVSFNIIKQTDSITKVRSLVAGIYLFELKVTDNGNLSAKDTIQITVKDTTQSNHSPVANAGTDQIIILPTNTINLNGSGSSDPDNNIVSYLWTKISGQSSYNITTANAIQTQVTNLVEGIYQFELKVTDAGALISKDTAQIIVSSAGSLNVNAGPDIIITLPLDSVYLEASTSVVTPLSFQWTQISGPSVVPLTGSGLYPSIVLAKGLIPGQYSFRVQANNSNVIADTMNVLVINDPLDPNTITFKNLKWHLADEYGLSIFDLDIVTSGQPNLFLAWDQLRPVQIYLKLDAISQWFLLPGSQASYSYVYDAASPHIWIVRSPRDDTWIGKESSVKIKI
jgi:hypothetical protein